MHNTEDAEGQLSVLYVEDEPIDALMMQALFAYRPMLRLVIAPTGEDATRRASTRPFALWLLDIHLPDYKGDELLHQLRQIPGCSETPAIAVTSDKNFKTRGSGFCEIWYKPFLLFHTLDRIDKRLLPPRGQTPPASQRLTLSAG